MDGSMMPGDSRVHGDGGSGIHIIWVDSQGNRWVVMNISLPVSKRTHTNIMELHAFEVVIKCIREMVCSKKGMTNWRMVPMSQVEQIVVVSDSQNAIDTVAQRTKICDEAMYYKGLEISKEIGRIDQTCWEEVMAWCGEIMGFFVRVKKVRSHTGCGGNDDADELAQAGASAAKYFDSLVMDEFIGYQTIKGEIREVVDQWTGKQWEAWKQQRAQHRDEFRAHFLAWGVQHRRKRKVEMKQTSIEDNDYRMLLKACKIPVRYWLMQKGKVDNGGCEYRGPGHLGRERWLGHRTS